MTPSNALQRQEQPQAGFGALLAQPPQPQGLTPTIVPLDRETLTFYGNMVTAAGLVPVENNVSPEMSKFRVMAKIVAGTSYGFDPILAQQCFDVVKNRMVPNAHGMEILFRDSGEYDTRIEQLDNDACVVAVLQRVGGEWDATRAQYDGGDWRIIGKVEFTFEMAKAAKLPDKNPTWNAFRQDMLYSKVMKRVVKRFNPVCLRPRLLLGNNFNKQQLPPPAAPDPAQLPAEASPASAPAETIVGQVHQDPVYKGPGVAIPMVDDDDDGPEAQVQEFTGVPQDAPAAKTVKAGGKTVKEAKIESPPQQAAPAEDAGEGELVDDGADANALDDEGLRSRIYGLLSEKTGGDEEEVDKILKGRVVIELNREGLVKLLGDLRAL